jgi:hypothetical protein
MIAANSLKRKNFAQYEEHVDGKVKAVGPRA